jgi:AhpD family alkylhydroperoxidase
VSHESIHEFGKERERLNEIVMNYSGKTIKRFYNLDANAYTEGALPSKFKELLGLIASFVLRCDDCIRYHLIRCHEEGVTDSELDEALAIGTIIGGTITIPHLRRAWQAWVELKTGGERSLAHESK